MAAIRWFAARALVLAVAFLTPVAPASAAGVGQGPSESLFLVQVLLLVVLGRLLGEAMVRIGQPSVMGQIIGGILLGPSVLGVAWPDGGKLLFPDMPEQRAMLDGLAQLGILFMLLLAGMETDLALAVRLRRAALGVSLTGIVVPFACGFALGQMMPADLLPHPEARLVASLFLGTALSISSVKIVASVVREMDFMRRNIGQLIVASAIIDDTVGWVIIAITFSIATHGSVDLMTVGRSILGTLAFLAFSFTVGRRIVFALIRWTNDNFRSDLPVLSAIIAIMGGMAAITHAIGVHTVLGGFVAGILVGQSPILTRQIDEQLRALTTALFMPVFFGLTGLHSDLTVLGNGETLALAAALILIASIGKFGGAFVGARFGGFTRPEALALGCGMNARGSTEVIVASIGLSVGVLDQRLFSVIVAMAVVTTMAMPPTLRWALARLPMREDERERLEREAYEDESYIAGFERLLLAVDRSASSELAARLSGLFAGSRKTPVSVLDVVADEEGVQPGRTEKIPAEQAEVLAETVRSAAAEASTAIAPQNEQEAAVEQEIHVGIKQRDDALSKVLADTAAKGHDLLFVGVEPTVGPSGGFDARIEAMAKAFGGTTAIVSARGYRLPEQDKDLRILVPFSGTERSVRAAEFAFLIAQATGCVVTVLSVRDPQAARRLARVSDPAGPQEAAFEAVRRAADHYGVETQTIVQEGQVPEISILRQARRGRYNLIILGVSRRAGERLSFGPIADTLLETSDRSFMFFVAE